ncbi:MAG: lactonase family protein [Acidobacteriota bacterium]
MILYVGTYTANTKSEGIYVYSFDRATGKLSHRDTVKGIAEPSFLAIDKKSQNLYAVNELEEYEGKPSGACSAFAINQKTGGLSFLNKRPSLGGAPCHVTASDNGKFVIVANYMGGNISIFPIQKGGMIGSASDFVQFSGSGPNKERQLSPHAHSVTLDRNNRFAFVADLGTDRVMIYGFDKDKGKLTPNPAQPFFPTKAGAGPRHFAFHPNGKLAFVINELDSTISSLGYDEKAGKLTEIKTLSTLSAESSAANACADVHVSPDGKMLYGSNRGQDTIAAFAIDQTSGVISPVEKIATGGKRPRNFVIDPAGNFLLAANQDTNNITVFSIDRTAGRLRSIGISIEVPSPVCLKFVTLPI